MTAFRALLILLWAILVGYTTSVITTHGIGLLGTFFGDMATMGWPGQFNLDFMFMLTLSALWVAWRHDFSLVGVVLALLALVGGSLFLTTYLFVISWQVNGDVQQMFIGKSRAAA